MKKQCGILFWSIHIIAPLLGGLLIYVLLRPDAIVSRLVRRLLPLVGQLPLHGTLLTDFGGDLCWAYALMCSLTLVLQDPKAAFVLCVCCGAAFELGQLFHVISGTFDVFDILVEALACVAARFAIYLHEKRERRTRS